MEVLREFKCAYLHGAEAPCASSLAFMLWRPVWRRSLSQDKIGEVYTISKEVMAKFGGTTKLVGNSLNCTHPLQGAAFGKGFRAKLPAARRSDTAEQLATAKCIVCDANYRCRHLDDSKLPQHCHASAPTNLMPGSTLT